MTNCDKLIRGRFLQYPLGDCLISEYVASIVPRESTPDAWLREFLALRDVSQFVAGAIIQYTINQETRDFGLFSSAAMTRDAVLDCLENMRMPPQFAKKDLIASFSDAFRVILPDTLSARRESTDFVFEDVEFDALDALCQKLSDRRVIHRASDDEIMRCISDIKRSIAHLDDPSGQFRSARPKLYVMNCRGCHLVGYTQMKYSDSIAMTVRPFPFWSAIF